MTDRIKGLIVIPDKDYRDDDIQCIVDAIKMIKGVSSVELSICDFEDDMNRSRIKSEIREKIWEFFYGENGLLK